jgi:formylglycine-generating enzyme required for sulfatase activity
VADEAPNRQENLDALLGNMAIHRGLLTHDQLRAALAEQGRDLRGGKAHPRPLGIILVGKGYLTDEQLLELLEAQKQKTQELEQSKKQDSLLGRILVQKGQISQQQLNECLGIQAASLEDGEEEVPRLGALLIKKGFVTPSLIMHALAIQQKTIMACEACSLRFNVQNYNPANPIPCPQCKQPLKPMPEQDSAIREGVSVSNKEIASENKGAHPVAPQPAAAPPSVASSSPTSQAAVSAEERVRQETLRQEAEIRAKAEAARAKAAAEKAQVEAEEKARVEEENKRRAEQAAKAKAEAESKAKAEIESRAKKKEEEEKARLEAIRLLADKAKAEQEAKAKAEAEAKAKTDKAKAEAEAKAKADKAKAEAEAKAKADKAKAEADNKAKADKARAEAEEKEESEKEEQEAHESAGAIAEGEADEDASDAAMETGETLSPEADSARRAEERAREEAEAMAHAVEERRRLKTLIGGAPRIADPSTEAQPASAVDTAHSKPPPAPRSKAPILVAALLLVGAACGGGYFYVSSQKSKLEAEINYLLQTAASSMASGRFDDALEGYSAVLAKAPDNEQAKTGRDTARMKLVEARRAAERAAEKAKEEAEARQKALEKRLADEKDAAKNAAEKDRLEAEARVKAIQAELDKAAIAKRESEERAQKEAARAKAAEEENRRRVEQEAKAKAEAESAKMLAQRASEEAEAKLRAKAEADKKALEDAERRAREAEKGAAEQSLTTAVLLSDKGDFPGAYKELEKARKGGVDPVPVGRRIAQKELSAIFALEDRDAKAAGYRRVLGQQADYLTDPLRDTAMLQLLQVAPPAGLTPGDKNEQGGVEFKSAKDETTMVYIPGGEFAMGADGAEENERPVRKVHVDGFLIDKTEVTVAQFRRFVDATKYVTEAEKSGGADVWSAASWESKPDASWKNPYFDQTDEHPVVCVSWNDAAAYCAWAGKRLPSEAEWEKAARGTDARKFPWGNGPSKTDSGYLCNAGPATSDDDGATTASAVGAYPGGASPFGILGMAGNVAEWCADWYDEGYYKKGVNRNPRGPASGSFRIRRGGSWFADPERCRTSARIWAPPVDRNSISGFRCARDAQ